MIPFEFRRAKCGTVEMRFGIGCGSRRGVRRSTKNSLRIFGFRLLEI